MNLQTIRRHLGSTSYVMLCIAAVAFPFSVAGANAALGASLATGVLGGEYTAGARWLWQKQRALTLALIAYLSLFPIGLLWSPDVEWGMHLTGRQWYWLLVPLAAGLLATPMRRNRFLAMLSLGLFLHLLFCVAQMYGWVELPGKAGSTASDATGHIGHTSFGFVYGLWAAWLVHRGLMRQRWMRWLPWLAAVWATGMVFMSEGRGGYMVIAALSLLLLWKLLRVRAWIKGTAAITLLLLIALMLSIGPGKERVISSWQSMQSMQQGDFRNPEARWSLWFAAIEAWRLHPLTGVGTGGYHIAAAGIKKDHPDLFYGGPSPAHPHNMYLQSLSRWGPLGLLLLTLLLVLWIRQGWKADWRLDHGISLVALSGVALAIQGLTEPSLEQHFPGILAVLLLAAGLRAAEINSCRGGAQSSASDSGA